MGRGALTLCVVLAALALAAVGCGGGSNSSGSIPTITAPTGTGTGASTGKTGPTRAKKSGGPKSASASGGAAAPVPEKKCGKIFFAGTESQVPVSAVALPCPTALAYAKRFVKSEQPSQQNLPSGWLLKDCTGINDAPPTPGDPNAPRCHHGRQAFTIHVSQ